MSASDQGRLRRRQFDAIRGRIDTRLAELAPAGPPSEDFSRVIRYSLLAPGKRLRPLLTVLTAASFGARESDALDPACAIEMIHTASLIVDDLPAMDNANSRRGRPTSHRAFGEDKAILAAFALVNQAFDVMSRAEGVDPATRLALVRIATRAIGLHGIIAGQEQDLQLDARAAGESSAEALRNTYVLKTGALFAAAAEAGARVAGVAGTRLSAVRTFAVNLGLAYQTRDDLIDIHSTVDACGKDVGADAGKVTLVSVIGEHDASALNRSLVDAAVGALQPLGPAAEPLVEMSRMIFETGRGGASSSAGRGTGGVV